MRKPIMVVTGGIATGKTTVARILAGRGGALVDCDRIGHSALGNESVERDIVRVFGKGVLTPSGRISRARLGRLVFSDRKEMERLNRLVRPVLKEMIWDEVRSRRRTAGYIVLDAVLFFQYKFRFKVDLVVRTAASRDVRVRRLVRRDGMKRGEAMARIEGQKHLEREWRAADVTVRTDLPIARLERRVSRIRDGFLASHGLLGGIE